MHTFPDKKEANKECTCDERDANGRCERGEADKKDKQTWKEHIFWRKILPNLFFSLLFALVFSQSKCASVYYYYNNIRNVVKSQSRYG